MLKKIKKYFLLIPLIMVLCFNVCVYGSVQAVDYSAYFHPWDDCPYDFAFSPDNPASISYDCSISSGTRDLYFYAVYMDSTEYDKYLNGLNYRLLVRVIDFYNPDAAYPTTKSENDYFIRFHGFKDNRLWSFSYDASTDSFSKTVSDTPRSTIDLIYFKDSGQIRSVPADAPDSDYFNDGSSVGSHFFMQYTNYPGFDLVNFENESTLDVQVRFSPDLTDHLDRSFTDSEGNTYLRSDLSMRVNNFSNFPIQYTMVITATLVDADNVFCYYSNDWVYSRSLDSYDDYYSDVAQKQQKSTFAHYVGSGQVDVVNFNFNQINLVQGGIYTVRVYAGRNDFGYASEFVLSSDDSAFEPYHLNYSVVYESTFSVLQYDDVKYDASNSSNGVLPYNYGLSEQYKHSYNAIEKENGEIDYTAKDVYSDNNSWYNQSPVDNSLSSSASSTSSFLNFTKSFKNFFAFINYMFNFLPKDAKTLFTIGFSGITIIALVKVLFKS